jgi:hypothetical protein
MTSDLFRSATFALDLSRQADGYLAPSSEVIDELRNAGLVTTQNVGDGFMIVRAVVKRAPRNRTVNGRFMHAAIRESIAP